MSRPNNIGNIIDKLDGLKPASFSNEPTIEPQTVYSLKLTDDAKFEITQFVTNALLVSQYAKYQDARAQGEPPADALLLANASVYEQELAYELINMTAALGVIGGTVLFRDNCPDIEVISLADAAILATTYPAVDWCLPSPETTNDGDRWLICNINPDRLTQFIKDKIEDGSLTPELLQWLKDRLAAGDISDELAELIQQLIDDGLITDIHGNPIGTGDGFSGDFGDIGSVPDGTNPSYETGDVLISLPNGCDDPILNFGYCSPSFSFDHADLRGAISDAAEATGNFDPDTEDLVTARLKTTGLAYGGIYVGVATIGIGTDTLTEGGNLAGILTIVDALGVPHKLPYEPKQFGLVLSSGTGAYAYGYLYNGIAEVDMLPKTEPVELTGEMTQLPVFASCRTPPDPTDAAWLKMCLVGFVKRLQVFPCDVETPFSWADGTDTTCFTGFYVTATTIGVDPGHSASRGYIILPAGTVEFTLSVSMTGNATPRGANILASDQEGTTIFFDEAFAPTTGPATYSHTHTFASPLAARKRISIGFGTGSTGRGVTAVSVTSST